VLGTGKSLGLTDGTLFGGMFNDTVSNGTMFMDQSIYDVNVGTAETNAGDMGDGKALGVTTDGTKSGLTVDLTQATGFSINDLRETLTIQHLLEIDARGGTRYTEILRAHFGVTVPDFRLQRPEYLGGSSQMVNINPVTQTSESGAGTKQGEQAAFATMDSISGYSKSFVEHGLIIGLVNIRADITYSQGLPKKFSRETRYDYYMPVFANLGEQAVLNKEIWFQNATLALDNGVFGYQEAWADLRYFPSQITGKLRVDAAQTLFTCK